MGFRFPRLLALAFPVFTLALGCGGPSGYNANPNNKVFSISPSLSTIDTNGQVQFTAKLASGGTASVHWAILNGQNSSQIGEGTIDQNGLYVPPSVINHDRVQIQIQANLSSDVFTTATAVITVTPGFNQVISPETATVSTGSTVPLSGTIDEYGGGALSWALSTSPTAVASPGPGYGNIGKPHCTFNSQSMTICTATYTAPGTAPAPGPLYAVATVAANSASVSSARLLVNGSGINTSPLTNQAVQSGAVVMGTSGGNNNDYDLDPTGQYITDCASGTLGALVSDQSAHQYILSNNHVLAMADQGSTTDPIIQPGLVDTGCSPISTSATSGGTGPGSGPGSGPGTTPTTARAIGTLSYWVPLNTGQTNVDAALATVATGAVDTTGAILATGGNGSNNQLGAAPPAGGKGEALTAANLAGTGTTPIQVVKSGRTTGLTCSTVDAVDATFQVDYYKDAAGTQFYTTKTFTNQISVPGQYFSDFGDSGSLLMDASNAQPVGLFFAGSSGQNGQAESFANPIGDVLSELSQYSAAAGSLQLQIVGGGPHAITCLNYDANTVNGTAAAVSSAEMQTARAAANTAGAALVNPEGGILGVAAGRSLDQPGRGAVILYVDASRPLPSIPAELNGVPTMVIPATAAEIAAGTAPTGLEATPGIRLSQAALNRGIAAEKQYAAQIMSDPAYFGVAVTESYDAPGQPALVVYEDLGRTPQSEPASIGGVRVRYEKLRRIRSTLARAR